MVAMLVMLVLCCYLTKAIAAATGEDDHPGVTCSNSFLQHHSTVKHKNIFNEVPQAALTMQAPGATLNTTRITPVWPGKQFTLACPAGTSSEVCTRLQQAQSVSSACFEPERETQEVLNSFLFECHDCLYIDIGCNIGYFAGQSAALGAMVECYEPFPSYTDTIKVTRELNNVTGRLQVHNAFVVANDASEGSVIKSSQTYSPCGIGMQHPKEYHAPAVSIRSILTGRRVKLLKIDIDSSEGALLHTVAEMTARNQTDVETILIEIGDNTGASEWDCRSKPCPPPSMHPRGGNIQDLYDMQHIHGYDVYRVNIHTAQEIYDWRGRNLNENMAPQHSGVLPMFSVRNMRKLEKVASTALLSDYEALFRWGVSFLLTRVQLAEAAAHHPIDLQNANISVQQLNERNPSLA